MAENVTASIRLRGSLLAEVDVTLRWVHIKRRLNFHFDAHRPERAEFGKLLKSHLLFVLQEGPHSQRIYRIALLYFGPLFYVIEDRALAIALGTSPADVQSELLSRLFSHGTVRQDRLQRDLMILAGLDEHDAATQLRSPAHPEVFKMARHMEDAVSADPCVLAIYAWILYSALLSQGSWAWGQLMIVRDDRWRINPYTLPSGTPVAEAGLEAWFFADGRTVKTQLRRGFEDLEGVLTTKQRYAMIVEAKWILLMCLTLARGLGREIESIRLENSIMPRSVLRLLSVMLSAISLTLTRWWRRAGDIIMQMRPRDRQL